MLVINRLGTLFTLFTRLDNVPMLGWWLGWAFPSDPTTQQDVRLGCPGTAQSESVSYHLEILKTWGFPWFFLSMFPFNQSWHVLKVEFLKDWMGPYSWPGIEDYRKKTWANPSSPYPNATGKDHGHQNTHVGDNNYQQSTYRLPLFFVHSPGCPGWILPPVMNDDVVFTLWYRPLKRPCWSIWTDGNTSGESAPASSSTRISPTQHLVIGSIGDQMICVRNAFSVCSTVCTNFSSSSPSSSCSCWWWWRRCWWKRSWKPAPD